MFKSLLISTISVLSALTLHAEKPNEETVNKHMGDIMSAAQNGEMDTILSYTHPNVIKLIGGVEGFKKVMGQFLEQIKKGEIVIVSSEHGKGEGYFKGDTHEVYYVRTKQVMKIGDHTIPAYGLQLGIKALDAKDWKYVEIANKPEKQIRALIPNIPEKFVLPTVDKGFFDKKKEGEKK